MALIILFAPLSWGTTRYIASAAGSVTCNGGTQTAITPASWNAITNLADDVIWICGTITGTGGSTIFTPLGNGSSGHPITINWDTGAIVQAPYCNTSNGCINMNGKSWYVFDGKGTGVAAQLASGGNPSGGGAGGGANGIIQCTANGTGLANQQDSVMINPTSSSHLTVQNLWLKDNYIRTANTSGSAGFNAQSISGTNATDILITNNWSTNSRGLLGDQFTVSGQNLEVSFNYTFATEVPVAFASTNASTTWSGLAAIHDNHFAGGDNQWDDPVSNSFHHDGGLHAWCQAADCHITTLLFYNNLTDGIWGNDSAYLTSSGGQTHITAYTYPEETGGDSYIFNNVYDRTAGTNTLTQTDNGDIFCKIASSSGATCNIFNNTFIGPSGNSANDTFVTSDGGSVAANIVVKNNIVQNQGVAVNWSGIADATGGTVRNNDYYLLGGSAWNTNSFATWQSHTQDPSPSVNGSDPRVNLTTYALGAGSSAIGIGANLYTFASCASPTVPGLGALCKDKNGTARPNAAWDAGALQFAASGGGAIPAPLTVLGIM